MEGASPASIADHLALAVAAGASVTTKGSAAKAIQDRYVKLKNAISRRSEKISLKDVADDPSSEDHRATLAKELDEHGAVKDRDVVTLAQELLGLIKIDDDARTDLAV